MVSPTWTSGAGASGMLGISGASTGSGSGSCSISCSAAHCWRAAISSGDSVTTGAAGAAGSTGVAGASGTGSAAGAAGMVGSFKMAGSVETMVSSKPKDSGTVSWSKTGPEPTSGISSGISPISGAAGWAVSWGGTGWAASGAVVSVPTGSV